MSGQRIALKVVGDRNFGGFCWEIRVFPLKLGSFVVANWFHVFFGALVHGAVASEVRYAAGRRMYLLGPEILRFSAAKFGFSAVRTVQLRFVCR